MIREYEVLVTTRHRLLVRIDDEHFDASKLEAIHHGGNSLEEHAKFIGEYRVTFPTHSYIGGYGDISQNSSYLSHTLIEPNHNIGVFGKLDGEKEVSVREVTDTKREKLAKAYVV